MKKLIVISLLLGLFSGTVQAKSLSILFIGNSYTYLEGQGDPSDPVLPKIVKSISESIDPDLQITYEFNTPGGWNFEKHFNDATSAKLMSRHYDQVILQGQSIESLELTPWWDQHGNTGVKSFGVYLPKVLDLVFKANTNVTLYVNWGWNPKNPLLVDSHPGLYFPPGSDKAGQKWCGKDKFEYQKMIDESYALHSKPYPVALARVGDAWISLQSAGLTTEDELYVTGDWSHPSVLGGFVAALVLVRDALHLDIAKNSFIPAGIDSARAIAIEKFLAVKE